MLFAKDKPKVVRVLTVADLHLRRTLYDQLTEAVEEHEPDVVALVGDFIDFDWNNARHAKGFLPMEEASQRLNSLAVPNIICVRGNHEDANWLDFVPGRIQSLNGSAFCLGPLVITGFPCLMGDETWFLEGAASVPSDAGQWFPKILRHYGPAARTLWLMHEPPDLTRLSMRSGPLSGNWEWREAIERYFPLAVVFGHDHQTPWRGGFWNDRIGNSLCLNAGQGNDQLYYFVIDATFEAESRSLPVSMVITHFPTKEVQVIPEQK